MYLRAKEVKLANDYKLILTFTNRETKIFDVATYLK